MVESAADVPRSYLKRRNLLTPLSFRAFLPGVGIWLGCDGDCA